MSQNDTQRPGTAGFGQVSAGRFLSVSNLLAPQAAGPGGSLVSSAVVDRCDPQVYLSAKPVIPASITLASGHSASIERICQHRTDSGDSWTALVPQADDLVIDALDAGTAQLVDLADEWDLDLSGAKQEIRIQYQVTLSSSGADRITVGGIALALLAGSQQPQY